MHYHIKCVWARVQIHNYKIENHIDHVIITPTVTQFAVLVLRLTNDHSTWSTLVLRALSAESRDLVVGIDFVEFPWAMFATGRLAQSDSTHGILIGKLLEAGHVCRSCSCLKNLTLVPPDFLDGLNAWDTSTVY